MSFFAMGFKYQFPITPALSRRKRPAKFASGQPNPPMPI